MRLFTGPPAPPTILEHITAHLDPSGCGLLPGGFELPGTGHGDDELRWMPGALDGVASHHFGIAEPEVPVDELVGLMRRAARGRFRPREIARLYERVRTLDPLTYVDPLMDAVTTSGLTKSDVREIGERLVTTARHVEPMKLGIALVGLAGDDSDVDLLLLLGRHEELTLYAAVAIGNCSADPDRALWALARSVDGWGRVHTVERLKDTTVPEIQDWLVRGGFRNAVQDEYLAYVAATTGRLLERLTGAEPDEELLDAACDIVSALLRGGPVEDIDDLAEAPRLVAALVDLLRRRARTPAHFVAVDDVDRFLADDEGWDGRLATGWSEDLRSRLRAACAEVKGHDRWPALAREGLTSDDPATFWTADRVAGALGLDRFAAQLERLRQDPIGGNWYAVMQLADDDRIEDVLELARASLPLDTMAGGPATSLGLGPEYAPHNALTFVLQDLRRFPGRGWDLVRVGLRCPVTPVRHMAVRVLGAWPAAAWPAAAAAALARAAAEEPDEGVRERMTAVLAHRD